MMNTLPSFIICLSLPAILMVIFFSMNMNSHSSNKDREFLSPFECGFSPASNSRMPFSLRFFLLAVLFLVFDVEIVILIPTPILLCSSLLNTLLLPFIVFMMIVSLGLLHEWNEGSLDWMQ